MLLAGGGGGIEDRARATTTTMRARTTVLACECPEHFSIRPRSLYTRVRRHSVFRFCFASVVESGEVLGLCRRLAPLAAARARGEARPSGSSSSSNSSASVSASAADAALGSLVRQLQDSTRFSADDLPYFEDGDGDGSDAAAAGEEMKKKKKGGIAFGRRVLGRRRRRVEEEEASSSNASPSVAATAVASTTNTSNNPPLAFECRALRITPLVSEPGRVGVSGSGDLLFKSAGVGGGVFFLPAASVASGALLTREWELRDCGLEVFAAPVFEDSYGKEFEREAEDEEEEGGAGGNRSSRRRSFDYRASFTRASPSSVPPAAAAVAALSPPVSSPVASPRLQRRRSSLSGNRGSSSGSGSSSRRRLPRQAPPSVFLAFETTGDRDAAAGALMLKSNSTTAAAALDAAGQQARALAAESARSWLEGRISSYAHLLRLNLLSGRSFHDLGKYPVFPWVLSDYESEELDLSCSSWEAEEGTNNDDNDETLSSSSASPFPPPPFRDLSKPVGALGKNPARLREFRERYRDLEQMARAVRAGERAAVGAAASREEANSSKKKKKRPLFACCAALPATLDDDDDDKEKGKPISSSSLPPASPVSDDIALEPFMYGCHFSTPGYCAFWLLRQQPQLALRLQGGKFDAADRLFLSLKGAWDSATSAPTDVKELVPQFFWRDPSLYLCPAPPPGGGGGVGGSSSSSSSALSRSDSSSSNAPFGVRSDGRAVGDVELPPWAWKAAAGSSGAKGGGAAAGTSAAAAAAATADALSAALESDAVASGLPMWIDLVFGCKSGRGPQALKADNVFYPMTYGDIARAALAEVEAERGEGNGDAFSRRRRAEALRVQAAEFGRCPEVLFEGPHPRVALFPRMPKKRSDKTSNRALSTLVEEEEEEEEKGKRRRGWAGALRRLGRLRGVIGKKKEKQEEKETKETKTKKKPEKAAAAGAAEVVSASSPSFAADEEQAAVAARLAAAARVTSHALSDIGEEDEEEG